MRVSYWKKIIVVLAVYLSIGCAVWFLSYYNSALLNHKLRILEKKEDLLNTVLEARRYEKNFFLTLHPHHLSSAVAFIEQAEEKLTVLSGSEAEDSADEGLELKPSDLTGYRSAMQQLVGLSGSSTTLSPKGLPSTEIATKQQSIRNLGWVITNACEAMVKGDRKHINRLIRNSQFYHLVTLVGMILITAMALAFFFYNVIRPLKRLEEAIEEIASGNYENIPSIAPAVEFESLVGSLNNMISMLNRRSEDFVQAKKLAALGTLTSGVAHELNNPLNNISTSMQILLEELEDTDLEYKRELLVDAEKEVERARDIVRALLEFSRQRAFSIKTVRFKPLVENVLRLIKGELPATVKLVVDVDDDILASVDFRRIQQVLLNLIFNAIQAMDNNGTLTISAHRSGDNQFCVKVSDTGKGIPAEMLRKIFDPFFSTKTTHRRGEADAMTNERLLEHEGTGLGLAICHGIVKKHGGRIEVQSAPGRGATFTVYLPMEKTDAAIS